MGNLAAYEARISKGMEAFLDTARAIYAIGLEGLFKPQFTSLTAYCSTRWDMDKVTTSRYRQAGEVLADLEGLEVMPKNEGQCREIAKLPRNKRKTVWQRLVKLSQKSQVPITAQAIKNQIDRAIVRGIESTEERIAGAVADQTGVGSDDLVTVRERTCYVVQVEVEDEIEELSRIFGSPIGNLYSRTVNTSDAPKLMAGVSRWFMRVADTFSLISFTVRAA